MLDLVRYCWAISTAFAAITVRSRIRTGGTPKSFPELDLEVCAVFCLQKQSFLFPAAGSLHQILTFSLPPGLQLQPNPHCDSQSLLASENTTYINSTCTTDLHMSGLKRPSRVNLLNRRYWRLVWMHQND